MKKLLSIFTILSILFLSSCNFFSQEETTEYEGEIDTITVIKDFEKEHSEDCDHDKDDVEDIKETE